MCIIRKYVTSGEKYVRSGKIVHDIRTHECTHAHTHAHTHTHKHTHTHTIEAEFSMTKRLQNETSEKKGDNDKIMTLVHSLNPKKKIYIPNSKNILKKLREDKILKYATTNPWKL